MAVAPKNLVIPNKTKGTVEYATDMRTIEQWCNQLKTGGTYASLTGPGQTTTPGGLTQHGYFYVSGTTTIFGDNFRVTAFTGNISILGETGTIKIDNNDGDVHIHAVDNGGGHNATLDLGVGTAGTAVIEGDVYVSVQAMGGAVGFMGATPITRPAVTGSRGGNAALASLLTALADLGLINDSTTP